ncbi:hypothetical protein VTI28DRAFT_2490 [Corynascus sepedonium]
MERFLTLPCMCRFLSADLSLLHIIGCTPTQSLSGSKASYPGYELFKMGAARCGIANPSVSPGSLAPAVLLVHHRTNSLGARRGHTSSQFILLSCAYSLH